MSDLDGEWVRENHGVNMIGSTTVRSGVGVRDWSLSRHESSVADWFRLDGRSLREDSRKQLLRHAQCHSGNWLLDQSEKDSMDFLVRHSGDPRGGQRLVNNG